MSFILGNHCLASSDSLELPKHFNACGICNGGWSAKPVGLPSLLLTKLSLSNGSIGLVVLVSVLCLTRHGFTRHG